MLGLEPQRLGEVAFEVGGALAGDAVDEIERDVVESGITESVHGASDVIRRRATLEHREEPRLEALRAERDAVHTARPEKPSELGRHGLRIRLDRQLVRDWKPVEQALELTSSRERRGATPEEDRLHRLREHAALECELGEQRVDVRPVLLLAADDGDEVAVSAAVRAERKVHVEMPHAHAFAHRASPPEAASHAWRTRFGARSAHASSTSSRTSSRSAAGSATSTIG